MRKTLTATMLAAVVAASGMAPAPAYAGKKEEQALLMILGAAAVVGIAKSMEDSRKKRKAAEAAAAAEAEAEAQRAREQELFYGPYGYYPPGGRVPAPVPFDRKGHKKDDKKNKKKFRRDMVLPLQCLRTPEGADRRRKVVGEPCLRKAGYRAELPKSCALWVSTPRGFVPGFGARCLADKGYVMGEFR